MRTTQATSLVPLWNRQEEWRRRLAMIAAARDFLYASTYYLEYDQYGTEFLDALDEACRRGVAVNLLIDGFGQTLGGVLMTDEATRALASRLDQLRQAGATVTIYRPGFLIQRRLGGGQHVKIQVSESAEAIFGSSNITASSFEHWHEFSVALQGPVVPVLLESYRELGGAVDESHLAQLRLTAATGSESALDYWFCNPNLGQGRLGPLGWRGTNEVTDRMVALMDGACTSVKLTAFYFKPIPPLLDAVEAAARRGVRVEVYHSHRDALDATDLAWIAAAATYDRLLETGVHIWEHRNGEHSKIVLVDDERVSFGSYNFEDAAHDRLAEAMLETTDDAMVAAARQIFDELAADSAQVAVTPTFRDALSPVLRLRLAVMRHFKRWM